MNHDDGYPDDEGFIGIGTKSISNTNTTINTNKNLSSVINNMNTDSSLISHRSGTNTSARMSVSAGTTKSQNHTNASPTNRSGSISRSHTTHSRSRSPHSSNHHKHHPNNTQSSSNQQHQHYQQTPPTQPTLGSATTSHGMSTNTHTPLIVEGGHHQPHNTHNMHHQGLVGVIPDEYIQDPYKAEPSLDELRDAIESLPRLTNNNNNHNSNLYSNNNNSSTVNLSSLDDSTTAMTQLLNAADADIQIHRSRIQASITGDPTLIDTYDLEKDEMHLDRQRKWMDLQHKIQDLEENSLDILKNLQTLSGDGGGGGVGGGGGSSGGSAHGGDANTNNSNAVIANRTRAEQWNERLNHWEKALEYYVLCSPNEISNHNHHHHPSTSSSSNTTIHNSTTTTTLHNTNTHNHITTPSLLELLDKLCHNCTSEEELTQILTEAQKICDSLLANTTTHVLQNAHMKAHDAEDAFHIRLQAHSVLAQMELQRMHKSHQKYAHHGREALRIGKSLEHAETRRRNCERACEWIRRWWMLENLAEQEDVSGIPLKVEEEVRGVIPSSSCRMDPLFTRPERSLEAARLLQGLRNVARGRGASSGNNNSHNDNNNNNNNNSILNQQEEKQHQPSHNHHHQPSPHNGILDPKSIQRFDRTNDLILRTSEALEKRLLNAFSETYSKGGSYDFTLFPPNKSSSSLQKLDWMALRELAEALSTFDSGRKLHERYVNLVVVTKFPQLFRRTYHQEHDLLEEYVEEHEQLYYDEPGNQNQPDYYHDDQKGKTSSLEKDSSMQEFNMDATRSKLSSLFHQVCEVCTKEFQLIAHVFSPNLPPHLLLQSNNNGNYNHNKNNHKYNPVSNHSNPNLHNSTSFSDTYPQQVARALLQRIISDPHTGMRARIDELLDSMDHHGEDFDFEAGSKKLDIFVVIHEKAAGLFGLLKEAAVQMWGGTNMIPTSRSSSKRKNSTSVGNDAKNRKGDTASGVVSAPSTTSSHSPNFASISTANARAIASLTQFLTTQEATLSGRHRREYINLELRILHHECCATLDRVGKLLKPVYSKDDAAHNLNLHSTSTMIDYRAPIMPLDKEDIVKGGYVTLLNGLLKQATLRKPLVRATDSLARARLMFGTGRDDGGSGLDSTARVILAIFHQMCNFYGRCFLYPIVESLGKLLEKNPPSAPPTLPLDESSKPHDLGIDGNFWISIERIHSAAKAFDRELWAENRQGGVRVWEILTETGSQTSLTLARDRRVRFFQELEERGEAVILQALDTLSAHVQWILVAGGEAAASSGGGRFFASQGAGPYAVSALLDSPNSPAVKALIFCLRAQFVHMQAALTPSSLSGFWKALSMRVHDILVTRILQNYYISTNGAMVLSRDVEALRSVSMLVGGDRAHQHWENLRELLTLYMTRPDALQGMLVGEKGLFERVGKERAIVFMSRRVDYRYKTNQGMKKSQWVNELLEELGIMNDPTDVQVNIAMFSAQRAGKQVG